MSTSQALPANSDIGIPLRTIEDLSSKSLVTQLIEIARYQSTRETSWDWARNLQCLSRGEPTTTKHKEILARWGIDKTDLLKRTSITGYPHSSEYVAASYCWEPAPGDESGCGKYAIGSADGNSLERSTVRDVVLDRLLGYTDHHLVPGFWIDSECINQDDRDEKEIAMQSMDLVYRLSKYPVGLLSITLESQRQLRMLDSMLRRELMEPSSNGSGKKLGQGVSQSKAMSILYLLRHIISDQWWQRAWIFQEEYRSSTRMKLLIRYRSGLVTKQYKDTLGTVPGEVEVNVVQLRQVATEFCQAYLQKAGLGWQRGRTICMDLLEKAARYNIVYADLTDRAMSPRILADIGRRGITVPYDLLAIVANCNQYATVLNTHHLSAAKHSVSLSLLALHVLNGEIIKNDRYTGDPLSDNIINYIDRESFDRFLPPVFSRRLTFLKHCRLVNVRITPTGIITTGRLWCLDGTISTENVQRRLFQFAKRGFPNVKEAKGGLNSYQRASLLALADELNTSYTMLAQDVYDYLDEDSFSDGQEGSWKYFMDAMAGSIVDTIRNGDELSLARLSGQSPYRAIFASTTSSHQQPSHVFTAWAPGKVSDHVFGEHYLDKYVSIDVTLDADQSDNTENSLPYLRTGSWRNGLCFFQNSSRSDVLFPWPSYLVSEGEVPE